MRTARWKSKRQKVVICPSCANFWVYHGSKDRNDRISCTRCKSSHYLGNIMLRREKTTR